ncbi:MAG: nucleotidyltransferase family protein, partial [Acidimicrobiales bacterium]
MRAVVLVGGAHGSLRALTGPAPAQLLAVAEVPAIERVIRHLAGAGVNEVVLSMEHAPDAFIAAFPSGRCAGVAVTYAVEPVALDTAGAIRFAARRAGLDREFIAVNGDVLTSIDLAALLDFHRSRRAEATVALTGVDDPSPYGVVSTEPDGRVRAFLEKPAPSQAPSRLVNAGVYVLEQAVLDRIAADRPVNVEREIFPSLVEAGSLYA